MFRCVLASLVSQECESDEPPVLIGLGACDAVRLRHALDEPGIDLAIELWMGPGAFDRLVEACASPQPNDYPD